MKYSASKGELKARGLKQTHAKAAKRHAFATFFETLA